jgi:hypothetical protein
VQAKEARKREDMARRQTEIDGNTNEEIERERALHDRRRDFRGELDKREMELAQSREAEEVWMRQVREEQEGTSLAELEDELKAKWGLEKEESRQRAESEQESTLVNSKKSTDVLKMPMTLGEEEQKDNSLVQKPTAGDSLKSSIVGRMAGVVQSLFGSPKKKLKEAIDDEREKIDGDTRLEKERRERFGEERKLLRKEEQEEEREYEQRLKDKIEKEQQEREQQQQQQEQKREQQRQELAEHRQRIETQANERQQREEERQAIQQQQHRDSEEEEKEAAWRQRAEAEETRRGNTEEWWAAGTQRQKELAGAPRAVYEPDEHSPVDAVAAEDRVFDLLQRSSHPNCSTP